MGALIRRYYKTTDRTYLLLCVLLSAVSLIVLASVSEYGRLELAGVFGNRRIVYTQLLAACLGVGGAALLSLVDYRWLIRYWPVHAAVLWGLVLLTFVPGVGYEPLGTGSRSWIALPFGMSFQPTELAKISFYLSFAGHLARVKERLNSPRVLFPLLAHLAAPAVLVHFQGDDGTALVFLAIGGIMLVSAGLNRWVVLGGTVTAGLCAPLVWQRLLTSHQKDRILGLLSPEAYADTIMYQQLQGRTAIRSGGAVGLGLFPGGHNYVPRAENDFFFSYFAEGCGFIGSLLLLALLFALILKTLQTARQSKDRSGGYLCIGVFATLLFQTVVNLGMNLMLLPVMGVTLPFLSAGGTSVVMLYLSIGLVLSVSRQGLKESLAGPG